MAAPRSTGSRQRVPALALLLALLVLPGCASRGTVPPPAGPGAGEPLLFAAAWLQTAAEFRAAALQAYNVADRNLAAALADSTWTAALEQTGAYAHLPPAIIVDVDETVVHNARYQSKRALEGMIYDEPSFDAWVRSTRAEAVPGAVEFLTAAMARGVTVFYLTGRRHAYEPGTRATLARLGFPLDSDVDVVPTTRERPEWTSDKSIRRGWIAERYRVLLLIGDDLNDFVPARGSLEERAALVRENAARWGRQWIIVPNPTHGSWVSVLHDYENVLDDEVVRRVRAHLDPSD